MSKVTMALKLVIISLLVWLTGCSGNKAPSTGAANAFQSIVTPNGELPIVKEKTTLKVMVKSVSGVESYADNEFTKWFEDQTNIHIEWDEVPDKNSQQKLNLVLASGDLPDVILGFDVSPEQQMLYGQQGVFLPLNNLIDKYGVNLTKAFQERPVIKEMITAQDHNIYALPSVADCFHCNYPQKLWIYKPWLDKLGLKVPSTTEEFRQVLTAFKNGDPNGNGKADEIPLAGAIGAVSATATNVTGFILSAFITDDSVSGIQQKHTIFENGKVDVAFNKPQWKEGLKYLNALFKDGLLAKESFTQDSNQYLQLGNSEVHILGAATATTPSAFVNVKDQKSPNHDKNWVAVPPLKGPNGYQSTPYNPYRTAMQGSAIITSKAKQPDVAIRLLDWFYNTENHYIARFGPENQGWRKAKPDEIGVDGKPATWMKDTGYDIGKKRTWSSTLVYNVDQTHQVSIPTEKKLYEASQLYEPHKKTVFAPQFYDKQSSAELADLTKTIQDYVTEMTARFVTGDADIDKEWDTYIKTLDSMNLKRYIEIQQTTYDKSKK